MGSVSDSIEREREKEGESGRSGLLKVPGSAAAGKEGGQKKESVWRRVAKFLILIGSEEAARVLSMLEPAQVERIVLEVASIRSVDPDEAAAIFAEFDALAKKAAASASGGVDTARDILTNAFGDEKAAQVIQKSVPVSVEKPFAFLESVSPEKLFQLLRGEAPAVRAAALSQCPPKLAAGAIACMPPEMKNETVLSLAKLKELNPGALRTLASSMQEKLRKLAVSSTTSVDGPSVLAGILRKMDGKAERVLLDSLDETDPALVKDIRDRLFTPDDILRADDRFLQEELRRMKDHDIAALIAGREEDFRGKILRNMSKLRGAAVLEEESACSPFSARESAQAGEAFFRAVRQGWESGKCPLEGEDEVWVN